MLNSRHWDLLYMMSIYTRQHFQNEGIKPHIKGKTLGVLLGVLWVQLSYTNTIPISPRVGGE